MIRRISFLVISALLSVAVLVPAMAAPTFADVPESHVFYSDIEWLSVMGITKGCNPPTNDQYCPNDYVTRGQMAAFLVRALGLTDDGGGNHFTDDNGLVFESDIDKLYTAGITQGCNPPTNDQYCPHNNVTRGQMAAFLVRALGLTDDGGGNHFTDDDSSVFESDIDKLYTAGITKGCNPPTNDQYCPSDYVTRGQMAAFLRRALDDPPGQVGGLIATLSGGSGEIDVSWDELTEPDIDHYNVWYSELPGDTKTLITDPYLGPDTRPGGRIYIIDWPRSQSTGIDCYQVSAVDIGGQEGQRSEEACFDSVPGAPAQVIGVTVGTGGGSGEAYVSWTPNSEGDMNYYNVYYSEFPGGPYVYEAGVDESVRNGSSRVFYIDWPVDLTVGKTCYKIGAVDLNEQEGPLSVEACFTP